MKRSSGPLATLGATLAAVALFSGCKKEAPPVPYEAVPVERRDIVVSAQASGAIQPDTTVEVKSKASGEILQLSAETGQVVQRGAPLVRIDPRNARNALAQAQADLDVAKAKLTNAASQKQRADALYKSQSITEQEHEQALLDYADAKSQVVRSQVSVDNARIQLEDTDVRAPITGTVLEKDVERGSVIASATSNVSGGTTLMKMANLNQVQVRALVDETDIGKLQPGQLASITVDAYPQHPFNGTVLKIEPQAQTEQNVTMFPVLIRIDNKEGLLRPGMNAEVEVHVGRRDDVLAVPNAALRTQRDVASAAQVFGLPPDDVQKQLAAARPGQSRDSSTVRDSASAGDSAAHATLGANPTATGGTRWVVQPRTPRFRRPRPARTGTRRRLPVHRLREAQWPASAGLDQNRSHRHGLQRSPEWTDRVRFGAGPSQRQPGAVAAGHARAVHPGNWRRRRSGHAAAERPV